MILDILQDTYICECCSDTVIPYIDLVNVTISGHKCFKFNFDFNINVDNIYVGLSTTSGATSSGYYGEIKDLGYPCAHYSFSDCLDQVNTNYFDLDFINSGVIVGSGVVCSGMVCDGSSYLVSEPYFLFDCAYTTLLYFKQADHTSGTTQDNMFFRAEGPNDDILGFGITSDSNLSLMLYNGTSEELIDTGLTVASGTWNLLSLRCSPKTKLRIGCNDQFIEINKPCAFLGGSAITYLGGKSGIGFFNGVLSDYTWWPNYSDNVFIENALTYPEIALNGQRRNVTTNITSSGVVFDLDKNYPSRIYLEFDFQTPNKITSIQVNTYDDNYVLASGVDTLFCGTVVRGHTSTDYPISLYNNTDYQTYAYMFAYDSDRYKALSVSSDAINYYSNQISMPGDVSWQSGEFESGINNDIIIDTPYNTEVNSYRKIILHDNCRKCLWVLSKDSFGFYDLRTKNFYTRQYPSFVTETVEIASDKNYWDFSDDNNLIYFIYYKTGVYVYNIISNTWSLLNTTVTTDNVCLSVSTNCIFYTYYLSGISEVFRYNLSTSAVDSVCSFNTSILKIESNENAVFVFNGNTIFKYDIDTLNVISISQHIGLTNVVEIKDICGYLSIITTSAVYSLEYLQDGWGSLRKVCDISSSFSISTVIDCAQNVAFVKSNEVHVARISHYRYSSTDVNIFNNYNNTLSLLPRQVGRYSLIWGWLDTDVAVPNFHIISKYSVGESIVYGFSRDTEPTAGIISIFMSFNSITKEYTLLAPILPSSLIDVDKGCLVETYDVVYYINFSKKHYYKYTIATDTWVSISGPKTYDSILSCNITSAVWNLDKKIYIAGESIGGYVNQSYDKVGDRHYSFFGYIDTDTDVIHSLYYLPHSDVVGFYTDGSQLTQGGTSFTCDLDYNVDNNYLFLAVSQYTSRASSYVFNMSVPTPSGSYVFDSLDDLYDFGCIVYNPFTDSRFNNLMNDSYFYTNYYASVGSSDIPNRDCAYITLFSSGRTFRLLGSSIGLRTNYEFSINARVKIPNFSSYMPVMVDSEGKDGFEVGFDNNDIFACCRNGTTYIVATCSMASAGVSKDDWVDLGASLSCTGGTHINLYINGQNVAASYIAPSCYGYTPGAYLHLFYTLGSPYKDNATSFYYANPSPRITELSVFNRVLSDQEFEDTTYSGSGKPLARITMDYNVINTDHLPQSSYIISQDPFIRNYAGITRVYSIYDYVSDYVYYFSDYTFIKMNVLTGDSSSTNLKKDYTSSEYDFATGIIKNCFISTDVNSVVGQSNYGLVYVGDVFDNSTKYYDTGSFVSPVIDAGETGIVAYNIEYSLVRDSSLEFYIRYADSKPVDFCHIYYINSSNNFVESSLSTGKVFHTKSTNFSKSCDVYYDDTIIKITIDGNVYKSTDYTTPINTFDLTGYSLANISNAWFSYNGSYILYYTSDKYLVGFPLSIGLPCMRSSVSYSSVNHVSWSKYAQQISVSVDNGVYVYNYMLGETDHVLNAYRIFYIYAGPIVIKGTDSSVFLNNDGVYYTYTVDDIDFSKNIEFDYVTEWIYYITLSGNLKMMRYIQTESTYELEFIDTGITGVNDIYKITFDYILLIVNANLTSYTKNGFISVSDYPLPYINSGDVVFLDYNPTNKTNYYNLNYLSNNDLIWSDLLDWIPLGSKSSGFVVGKRYIQLKAIFKTSSNKNATPILSRIYFGSPIRVGPILPKESKDFFVRLEVPLDDQGDIYSVKLITLAEDIVR